MKKKNLLTMFIFLFTCIFCLNFVGCNKQKNINQPSIQKIEKEEKKLYSIDEKTDNILNYDIKYPIFINFEDKEKENKLNDLIEQELINMFKLYEGQKLSNIQYIITNKNDSSLSILYTATFTSNSYPQEISYPINIDITNNSLYYIDNDIEISNYEILNVDDLDLKQAQLEYIQSINIRDYFNKFYKDYENNVILIIPVVHAIGDNIYLRIIN